MLFLSWTQSVKTKIDDSQKSVTIHITVSHLHKFLSGFPTGKRRQYLHLDICLSMLSLILKSFLNMEGLDIRLQVIILHRH